MKTSISKFLGFGDREVREIFREEENLLLKERDMEEKKQKNSREILIVKGRH